MQRNDRYDLARLLAPLTPETFFREHWERAPLVLHRDGSPGFFDDLLTLEELDRVVTTTNLHHPALGVVRADRKVNASEYAYPSGLIDAARVAQQHADGGTLVFQQLDLQVPALGALCRSMEAELSTRFQTNVYLTPPDAQGFPAHYDSHDVFVLQCHGSKHWRLYDTPVELPYRTEEFDPARVPLGPVTREFTLRPGDVAYIPRGVMHDARTDDGGTSLHITLGVLFTAWAELVLEAVARVSVRDARFRKTLPVGFARPDFDRASARETFRELLATLAREADFDGAFEHFVDDLVGTRHPQLPGALLASTRIAEVSLDTPLAARPAVLYTLREEGEQLALGAYGAVVRLPHVAREAVAFALRSPRFTPRELPGALDDASRVTLARRLLREGLLALA